MQKLISSLFAQNKYRKFALKIQLRTTFFPTPSHNICTYEIRVATVRGMHGMNGMTPMLITYCMQLTNPA